MDLKARLPAISIFAVVIAHFLVPVLCQNDPRDQNAVINTFYLTSKSDCSNDLKNIFNYEAVVQGYDLKNIGTGPTSCTIRITSQSPYPGVQLQIQIIAMDIQDRRTQVSIYDGQGTQKLGSYDSSSSQYINRKHLVTSGDTVTIIMTRDNPDNHKFDIEIRIKPIRGGIDPDYDKFNYFSFQKFDQDAIVGMIGGMYALVIIICIAVVIYFNAKYRGMNQNWETHQLSTMKTDTTLDARSQVSQLPWSMANQSREPVSSYARSYTATEPYSRKGAYPRSEDGSSVVYDHDEKFQQRNLMNDERDRHRGRDRDRMASQNSTYSDDEDPDNFKEKVITPRVQSSGARWKPQDRRNRNRDRRPPSFEEATRRSSSEERSSEEEETEEETEESSDNDSTRKRLTTSSEGDDDSDDYSDSETASESENSYASSSRRGGGARARRSNKKKKREDKSKAKSKARRRRQSSTDDASSQRTSEPRRNGKHPQRGQSSQQPPMPMGPPMPYGAYPPPPGGQFVPVMTGPPPPFQPVPMVPPSYPPPQYPTQPQDQPIKPTDPPVYSYLVRRGYTPMDPNNPNRRDSPAGSVASGQGGPRPSREEPDTPLQSGVEYMRR